MEIWQRHPRGAPSLYTKLPRSMTREECECERDRLAELFVNHAFWLK